LIEGIPGECTTKGFEDHIQILSFGHNVSQSSNMSSSDAGGATTGRCSHGDFSIVKSLDKASALLNQQCSSGVHIPNVSLVLVRSGGTDDRVPYMEYKLATCIVSSVSIGGGGGDDVPTESVTFNYGKIDWTYTQQHHDDGSGGGKTTGSWNLQTNATK
jgi:type VI secretion system secreted protein Hcp